MDDWKLWLTLLCLNGQSLTISLTLYRELFAIGVVILLVVNVWITGYPSLLTRSDIEHYHLIEVHPEHWDCLKKKPRLWNGHVKNTQPMRNIDLLRWSPSKTNTSFNNTNPRWLLISNIRNFMRTEIQNIPINKMILAYHNLDNICFNFLKLWNLPIF